MIASFVGHKAEVSDFQYFFNPGEKVEKLPEHATSLAHLLVSIGKFSSVKEAKRNGFNRPIPLGWSEFVIGSGKNRLDLRIWNPRFNIAEFDEAVSDAGGYPLLLVGSLK